MSRFVIFLGLLALMVTQARVTRAADTRNVNISMVIFDQKLQPLLHGTKAWPDLAGRVRFSEKRSWVRHDEHHHIDFDIPCRSMR